MIEVRFHGRGGQGVVLASEILANAAFLEGKQVQSFPFFGVERRGAPLMAFARLSYEPIRVKSVIRTPDYVVVLDPSLLRAVDVASGLRTGGLMLVNGPPELKVKSASGCKTLVFDATSVSLEHGLGTKTAPIVNTAILGAFAAATGLVQLESLERSIPDFVPGRSEANVAACRAAYQKMMEEVEVLEG
jgi:2-oxoacid:acceptor oxidoreductase gamma subunit (pyruvate/2-ketoisovalerate family)